MHRLQQPQPAMGLAEVISARPYRLGASPIAYAALQCFSAYNVPAYTEALVCMSGAFSNLSEIVDRTTCPGPCSQFREIGLNGYMARGADQENAGKSVTLLIPSLARESVCFHS